jgi:hypothetical protein
MESFILARLKPLEGSEMITRYVLYTLESLPEHRSEKIVSDSIPYLVGRYIDSNPKNVVTLLSTSPQQRFMSFRTPNLNKTSNFSLEELSSIEIDQVIKALAKN